MLTVHVISLRRREDRRQAFQARNAQSGLEIRFVEAVDGRSLDLADLQSEGLVHPRAQHFTPGALGAALSHRNLWASCAQADQPLLIAEDDAVLGADFSRRLTSLMAELPTDWDVLLLGYNFDSVLSVEMVPGIGFGGRFSKAGPEPRELDAFKHDLRPVTWLPLNEAFGLCCYLLSPKAARQLLQLCFPMSALALAMPSANMIIDPARSLDMIMNAHYRRLQTLVCLPPLALTPNDQSDTDIPYVPPGGPGA